MNKSDNNEKKLTSHIPEPQVNKHLVVEETISNMIDHTVFKYTDHTIFHIPFLR